tara:strand:- start:1196 stop:1438 length:243 start_codon:yes stop_codon:yes gene_type:complete
MTWFTGTATFLIVWWLVLFAVLPWGVKAAQRPQIGTEHGAPENPNLWRKALVTTLIALLIWGVVFVIIDYGMISIWGPSA